jgi:hypothetical protein
MSLLLDGKSITSFSYADIPSTYLSTALAASLGPSSRLGYLFTVSAGSVDPVSFPLVCVVSSLVTSDVVLGRNWAAYYRDMLLFSGLRLSPSFDSWTFFSSCMSVYPICCISHPFSAISPSSGNPCTLSWSDLWTNTHAPRFLLCS